MCNWTNEGCSSKNSKSDHVDDGNSSPDSHCLFFRRELATHLFITHMGKSVILTKNQISDFPKVLKKHKSLFSSRKPLQLSFFSQKEPVNRSDERPNVFKGPEQVQWPLLRTFWDTWEACSHRHPTIIWLRKGSWLLQANYGLHIICCWSKADNKNKKHPEHNKIRRK